MHYNRVARRLGRAEEIHDHLMDLGFLSLAIIGQIDSIMSSAIVSRSADLSVSLDPAFVAYEIWRLFPLFPLFSKIRPPVWYFVVAHFSLRRYLI